MCACLETEVKYHNYRPKQQTTKVTNHKFLYIFRFLSYVLLQTTVSAKLKSTITKNKPKNKQQKRHTEICSSRKIAQMGFLLSKWKSKWDKCVSECVVIEFALTCLRFYGCEMKVKYWNVKSESEIRKKK